MPHFKERTIFPFVKNFKERTWSNQTAYSVALYNAACCCSKWNGCRLQESVVQNSQPYPNCVPLWFFQFFLINYVLLDTKYLVWQKKVANVDTCFSCQAWSKGFYHCKIILTREMKNGFNWRIYFFIMKWNYRHYLFLFFSRRVIYS